MVSIYSKKERERERKRERVKTCIQQREEENGGSLLPSNIHNHLLLFLKHPTKWARGALKAL